MTYNQNRMKQSKVNILIRRFMIKTLSCTLVKYNDFGNIELTQALTEGHILGMIIYQLLLHRL